jgi:hypothetical protein
MQRIIGFVLIAVGALVVFNWLKRQSQRPHHKDTFRPEANGGTRPQDTDSNNQRPVMSLVGKRKAAQTRDALTGAPIDIEATVWQCQNCQSLYHHDSVQALVRDNQGQCTQCKATHRQQVVFIDD